MKKIILLCSLSVLVAGLLIGFASCGSDSTIKDKSAPAATSGTVSIRVYSYF